MMRIGIAGYSYLTGKPVTFLQSSNRINLGPCQMDTITNGIGSSKRKNDKKVLASEAKGRRGKHSLSSNIEPQLQKSVESSFKARQQVNGRTSSSKEFHMMPSHLKIRTLPEAEIASNSQNTNNCESPARSSLSIKASPHPDTKGKALTQSCVDGREDEEDCLSLFTLDKGPPILPLHVEEVKSARRKSWGFIHKTPESTIVMFPNPTFDQKSADDALASSAIVKDFNDGDTIPLGKTCVLSSFSVKPATISQPSLTDMPDPTLARTPHPPGSSKDFGDQDTSGRKIDEVQHWLSVLTQTSSPIVIRRLPELHEMQGITQASESPDDFKDQKSSSTSSDSVASTGSRNSGHPFLLKNFEPWEGPQTKEKM